MYVVFNDPLSIALEVSNALDHVGDEKGFGHSGLVVVFKIRRRWRGILFLNHRLESRRVFDFTTYCSIIMAAIPLSAQLVFGIFPCSISKYVHIPIEFPDSHSPIYHIHDIIIMYRLLSYKYIFNPTRIIYKQPLHPCFHRPTTNICVRLDLERANIPARSFIVVRRRRQSTIILRRRRSSIGKRIKGSRHSTIIARRRRCSTNDGDAL